MVKEINNIRIVSTGYKGLNTTVCELYNSKLPKYFKISKNRERFWVQPTNEKYKVKVCNNLYNSKYKPGDIIKVSPKANVYEISN